MARTVVTKTRKAKGKKAHEFQFSREMIPVNDSSSDFIKEYKEHAWKAYQELAMPTTNDEPWRRTDLRKLNVGSFHLPMNGDRSDFPEVPDELLEPLVSDEHAGQLVITPGGAQTSIDQSLIDLGVVFSDLKNDKNL